MLSCGFQCFSSNTYPSLDEKTVANGVDWLKLGLTEDVDAAGRWKPMGDRVMDGPTLPGATGVGWVRD